MCSLKKITSLGGIGAATAIGGLPGFGAFQLGKKLLGGKKPDRATQIAMQSPEYQAALAQGVGHKKALKTAAVVQQRNAEAG